MTVALLTDPRFADHVAGSGHPERPARLDAVLSGIVAAHLDELVTPVEFAPASEVAVARVHTPQHLAMLERISAEGGGRIDPDTAMNASSSSAARLAAGAGIAAIALLDSGVADAAFCAVRPPGHHATANRAQGFCLINSVAVAAAALAERGDRVLIVDFDAHHGNGTQDVFYDRPDVAFLSFHEFPQYPGSGRIEERGRGAGWGSTVNLPFPAGTTGDTYRAAFDEIVVPFAERFGANWLLLSAGFDAHRADPLTSMALTSGDVGDLVARLVTLVPHGRSIAFLEGGYDLDALAACSAATVASLGGVDLRPEELTNGGPGRPVVGSVVAALAADEARDGVGEFNAGGSDDGS